MNYKLIEFHVFGDNRGNLVSLEEERNVPFKIKRMYYIYGTKAGVERGRHAHTHLKQVIICVKGSCTFILDDGVKRKELKLCQPHIGLYIGENVWREMKDFSKDCVLLVLADEYYNEKEYIRDYESFLKLVHK